MVYDSTGDTFHYVSTVAHSMLDSYLSFLSKLQCTDESHYLLENHEDCR